MGATVKVGIGWSLFRVRGRGARRVYLLWPTSRIRPSSASLRRQPLTMRTSAVLRWLLCRTAWISLGVQASWIGTTS
ncbi:hypothetical protein D9M70_620920 [compost metagenome]